MTGKSLTFRDVPHQLDPAHVEPNRRIAQRWVIEEPGLGGTESLVEMELVAGWRFGGMGSPFEGTTLVLRHSGLPAEQTTFDVDWWEECYFAPMDAYFGGATTGGPGRHPDGSHGARGRADERRLAFASPAPAPSCRRLCWGTVWAWQAHGRS